MNKLIFLFIFIFSSSLAYAENRSVNKIKISEDELVTKIKQVVYINDCAFYERYVGNKPRTQELTALVSSTGIPLIEELKSRELPDGTLPYYLSMYLPAEFIGYPANASAEEILATAISKLDNYNNNYVLKDPKGKKRKKEEIYFLLDVKECNKN